MIYLIHHLDNLSLVSRLFFLRSFSEERWSHRLFLRNEPKLLHAVRCPLHAVLPNEPKIDDPVASACRVEKK